MIKFLYNVKGATILNSRYICPVCSCILEECEKTYKCQNNHCFDVSAEGYINLASTKKGNTEISGDAADTCRARRRFLEAGHYKPLADKICSYLSEIDANKNPLIVDAGCGEGYYSRQIKSAYPAFDIYGIDLAKQGIKMAAKYQKSLDLKCHYSVAGIFDMPFESESADAIISVFAPVADRESYRVLCDGGLLIVACPGKNHLFGLKEALYETPTQNEEKIPDYEGFILEDTATVTYRLELDGEDASALFAMTPYFWRSSKDVREKSADLGKITTDADFIIKVYRKIKSENE